jgi:acetyltransferase-like isoleucine patch superfamily enzyme
MKRSSVAADLKRNVTPIRPAQARPWILTRSPLSELTAGALSRLGYAWALFWMRFAGLSSVGRAMTRLATWFFPPYKERIFLAHLYPHGYIAPSARFHHDDLHIGPNVFVGDRAVIFAATGGGAVELGERVDLHQDVVIETGDGGSLTIGARSRVQAGCQLIAYKAGIRIGVDVGIAQRCMLFSHNHGAALGTAVSQQPLETKGPIVIGDHAWLGAGVIVLSGVRIGKGAVIGAGAVVTRDVPDDAIAVGVPARVVRMRGDATVASV